MEKEEAVATAEPVEVTSAQGVVKARLYSSRCSQEEAGSAEEE